MEKPFEIILEQLQNFGTGFFEHLPQIIVSILILIATWGLVKLVNRLIERVLSRADLNAR